MSTDSGSDYEGEHHHPRLHAVSESLHEHEESYLRACQARWARVQGSAAGAEERVRKVPAPELG